MKMKTPTNCIFWKKPELVRHGRIKDRFELIAMCMKAIGGDICSNAASADSSTSSNSMRQ